MEVRIPSPLRSYTKGKSTVDAEGETLSAVLANLESNYPGIRFRMIDEQGGIRQHIKIFINTQPVQKLDVTVAAKDVVYIIAALSGG